ncbi:BLUF domain-containing protein [Nonlabens ponticola]|uniref:BLUF domain-containing protein n=1 Tax=Nonlabens ponticola TaxID=2496866 RepID=UPI0013E0C2B5|nr:BLUF domain-containing protein [Nonlabens ponticola]
MSKTSENLSDEDITNIFEYSKERNDECDVSGILLHSIGNFFQVLEGNEKHLKELYEKIKKDDRHGEIFEVYNKPTAHPVFLHYSSKFNIVKTTQDLESINQYLQDNREISTSKKLERLLAPFLMMEELY